MTDQEAAAEIARDISGPRGRMLDVLRLCGGEATTRTVREDANVPDGSVHYHLRKLRENGVIEQAGSRRVESGETADVHRLTDLGHEVVTAWLDDRGRLDLEDFDSRLRDHARRLNRYEDRFATADDVAELRQEFEQTRSEVDDLISRIQQLREDIMRKEKNNDWR